MGTAAEVLQVLGGSSPGWFVASAVLLGLAYVITRRQAQSAINQGRRIGRLEKTVALEVVRRRQVESVLLADGLRLPWWGEDNTPLWLELPDDVEQLEPETTVAPRPPVPPAGAGGRRHSR